MPWAYLAALLTTVWLVPPAAAMVTGAGPQQLRRRYRIGTLAAVTLGCLYIGAALAFRVFIQLLL